MIHVILYGKDKRGLLTLKECRFTCLRELSSFFCSPKAVRWEWAEVEIANHPDQTQLIRYTADALRSMIVSSSRAPSLN